MRINTLRRLAAITIIPLSLAVVSVPAYAAQGDCASGYNCMWEHSGYQGGAVSFKYYIPDLSKWHLTNGHKANDKVSSIKNNGVSNDVCVFKDAYGAGEHRYIRKGERVYNLRSIGFNDQISSAYFTGFKSC